MTKSKAVDQSHKSKNTSNKVKTPSLNKKTDHQLATSMVELMARKEDKFKVPKKGERVKGVITEVTNRTMMVDIGAKTEGMVMEREFEDIRDFHKSLIVGDEIEVFVVSPENDRGQILVSVRTAAQDWQWRQLTEWMTTGKIIEVRGLDVNRGGIIARIDSFNKEGFVPASQLGVRLSGQLENLVNRLFQVKIIEVDRQNNRLIFSEKQVSEAGRIEARKEVLKKIKIGNRFKGTVVGTTDFGAFVKIVVDKNEIEGLVHISELSWEKVDIAGSVVKTGDEVEVVVLDVNPQNDKIAFSIKHVTPDPWDGIEGRFPPGKKFAGTVTKVASFGAIVQLEPGVSGLLHISKIPTDKEPAAGDKIEVMVEDLDRGHRKLALGMAVSIPVIYK